MSEAGHIYAFLTGERVRWAEDSDGHPIEDPIQENGWVDRAWSPYVFHDSRNDVRPVVDADLSDREMLSGEITDALGWLPGGWEDNGDGIFYGQESDQPSHDNPEEWAYSYALHFVRKFYGPDGWTEQPWHPSDGGFEITE